MATTFPCLCYINTEESLAQPTMLLAFCAEGFALKSVNRPLMLAFTLRSLFKVLRIGGIAHFACIMPHAQVEQHYIPCAHSERASVSWYTQRVHKGTARAVCTMTSAI